jgi:hypothetical protein
VTPAWRRLLAALLLTLAAGALRFHRLGDWPFAGDELATIEEAASLAGAVKVPNESQVSRLPRAIPLSYAVHYAGYRLLGESELASRLPIAAIGSLTVGVVFWLLARSSSLITALAASLLILVWPQHLFHSQENRFYAIAALGAFVALLCGAAYARRHSSWTLYATYGMALLTVLTHTVTIVLLPLVTVAIVAAARVERRTLSVAFLLTALAAHAAALALLLFYVLPLLGGWNPDASWAYTVPHAVLASANRLGWPIALVACLGGALTIRSPDGTDRYWLVATLGFGLATVVLPLLLAYHPEYVLPLMLAPIVLAGRAVSFVVSALRTTNVAAAGAALAFLPLLQLPGMASHFADGSRVDLRTAAAYVEARCSPGARVTAQFVGTFQHYAPRCAPTIPLSESDPVAQLTALTAESSAPLWVVIQTGRSGFDARLQTWLSEHCQRRLEVREPRLDYYDHRVDVYACSASEVAAFAPHEATADSPTRLRPAGYGRGRLATASQSAVRANVRARPVTAGYIERPATRCLIAGLGETPGSDRLSHAPPEPPGGGVASTAARTLRAKVRAVPGHCRTRRKAGARFQAPASGHTPGSDLLSHATAERQRSGQPALPHAALRAKVRHRSPGHCRTVEEAREPDWLIAGLTNTPGSDLLSHALSHAVPSAVAGLTSVFGMGTGVTLLLWPPGNLGGNGVGIISRPVFSGKLSRPLCRYSATIVVRPHTRRRAIEIMVKPHG